MADVVAIYTRVSKEDLEEPASTRRQERACRRFADSKGWQITGVWEDVDVSAYQREVRRKAFEDLMVMVAGGRVDGVIVWKLDRLVRRVADFERFWSRCDRAGVFLASATERIDSTTEMGLAVIRILVTFANVESTSIALRLAARMEERARAGEPLIRGRVFGRNETWTELVEEEADAVREASRRFLDGEALGDIAADLNRRGLLPPRGKPWTMQKLSVFLQSPRLVGDNTFHGEVVKRDAFPPILDRTTGARVRAHFVNRGTKRRPRADYLLSGLLRCAVCGRGMTGAIYRRGGGSVRRYHCPSRPGGNHVSIRADFVEDLVVAAVLARLERRPRPHIEPPPDASEGLVAAYEEHAAALRALAADYYVGRHLTHDEWQATRDALDLRLAQARRAFDPTWRPTARSKAKGPVRLRRAWPSLDAAHRRDVIASQLHYGVIGPRQVRWGGLDPTRIRLKWWDEEAPIPLDHTMSAEDTINPWDHELWVGTEEAAQILGIPVGSVTSLVRRGRLPAVSCSRHYRYRRTDIEQGAFLFTNALTSREVAEQLGVSRRLITEWIERGQLPAAKRGRYYVRPDDLQIFCDTLEAAHAELIGLSEAASLLHVSRRNVNRMALEGRFHSLRVGEARVLQRDEVMAEAKRPGVRAVSSTDRLSSSARRSPRVR